MKPKRFSPLIDIKLTIIVACYNEEDIIELFYQKTLETISKYDYRFIFIDDGSKDTTLKKLISICKSDNRVQYISLSRNFGQQNALKAGYDHATDADCVVCMDADLQHPPETIDALVKQWVHGFDIVNTVRRADNNYGISKRALGKIFYCMINFISKSKILINGPDYRLLDRKVVHTISKIEEGALYFKEIIPWLGFRQTIVEFSVNKRLFGKSKYSILKLVSLSLRGITSFSTNPLRFSSVLGLTFSFLAFLYGAYAVYVHLFTDRTVPGWTSIIASVLFIAGIQMLMLGIIGEYLGKAFIETKKRPQYVVRESTLLPEVYDKDYDHHPPHVF